MNYQIANRQSLIKCALNSEGGQTKFVNMMTLMYEDGDDDGSAFVNIHHKNVDEHFNASCVPSANDDNIPKILQCA